jgi:hypothetical protein
MTFSRIVQDGSKCPPLATALIHPALVLTDGEIFDVPFREWKTGSA